MSSLKALWDRLKKIKHIEIYVTVVFALVIIAIYLSSLGGGKTQNDNLTQTSQTEFSSSAEYVDYLENKLDNVLSSIKGVSSVKLIITLESGFEYDYATQDETVSSSQGNVTTSKLVMVDGKPVITKEHYPKIKGIVVVAKGAEDLTVKMNILTAIQTVIQVESAKITILAAN